MLIPPLPREPNLSPTRYLYGIWQNMLGNTSFKLPPLPRDPNIAPTPLLNAIWEATKNGIGGLPNQTGHAGEFLTTDGTTASWGVPGGGGDMLAATYDPAGVAAQLAGANGEAINAGLFLTALGATVVGAGVFLAATPAAGRSSLGATTVGDNFFTLANPGAITFPRINADNTVTARSAADFLADIGGGTSSFDGTWASLTGRPARVDAFAALADAAGVLTNNGAGVLSYTGTSLGGNGAADSGKLAMFGVTGGLVVNAGAQNGVAIVTSAASAQAIDVQANHAGVIGFSIHANASSQVGFYFDGSGTDALSFGLYANMDGAVVSAADSLAVDKMAIIGLDGRIEWYGAGTNHIGGANKTILTPAAPVGINTVTIRGLTGTMALLSDITGTNSGVNTGDQTITLTTDVTGSGTGSFAATIANGAVTLAKMADMATASLIYRTTAGTGAPEVNTLATLKTDLLLTGTNSGDQTSIVGITGTMAQFNTAASDGDFAFLGAANNFTAAQTISVNSATGVPSLFQTGTWAASATGPVQLIESSARTIAFSGNVNGTALGINAAAAFTGNAIDYQLNGTNRFKVTSTGAIFQTSTAGVASISFNSTGGSPGLGAASSGAIDFWTFGAVFANFGGGAVGSEFTVGGTGSLGFSASSNGTGVATRDAFFMRKGAASIQLGANAAGVTDQTFTAASRITSDGVGANLTLVAGNGRGGAAGNLILSSWTTAATGVAGTLTTMATIDITKLKIATGKGLWLGNAAVTGLTAGVLSALTNASIVMTDDAGQDYRIPCII